ncbi:MAG: carbonic anhydrase [Lachnospiraceae bacterium]|nr:carbonic anhydrase [Lachnospiraceae bacterium]
MNGREAFVKLMKGNEKYSGTGRVEIDASAFLRHDLVENGQHPIATVICCSDSRVVPEAIFSVNIGELFVIRVAGNVIGAQEMGSIEYAVGHLHTPLVFVLGHDHCGAVAATLEGGAAGFIAAITNEIQSAIDGETNPDEASKKNVRYAVEKLKSAVKHFHGEQQRVILCGGVYHQISGKVEVVV